jgi:hypothetical protein
MANVNGVITWHCNGNNGNIIWQYYNNNENNGVKIMKIMAIIMAKSISVAQWP